MELFTFLLYFITDSHTHWPLLFWRENKIINCSMQTLNKSCWLWAMWTSGCNLLLDRQSFISLFQFSYQSQAINNNGKAEGSDFSFVVVVVVFFYFVLLWLAWSFLVLWFTTWRKFCSFDSLTGIRVCDALCMEGGYRLLSGECNMQLIGRTIQIITLDILYGLPVCHSCFVLGLGFFVHWFPN